MSRSIMTPLAVAALVGLSAASVQDESAKQAAVAKTRKLDAVLGKWEGEGTVTLGPGRTEKVHQTGFVRRKLGGAGFHVEGRGTKPGTADVAFEAVAVLVPAHVGDDSSE